MSEKEISVEVIKTSIEKVSNENENQILFPSESKNQLIQAFVNSEVAQFGLTSEGCLEVLKRVKKKKIKDKDDKKGYTEVKEALKELVNIRTSTEKKRKELNEPYNLIKKGIDEYAKQEIVNIFSTEEARLKAEKEKFEKWEEEEKVRKAEELRIQTEERINELKSAGVTFDGSLYVIGEHISFDIVTVQKMKEKDYSILLEKVKLEKEKADKIEAERLEAERKEKEKQEALKAENERKEKELLNEKIEARREILLFKGFEDLGDKFNIVASDNSIFSISYDEAGELNAADFKNSLEYILFKVDEIKNKPVEEPVKEVQEIEKIEEVEETTETEKVNPADWREKDISLLKEYLKALIEVKKPTVITEEIDIKILEIETYLMNSYHEL